MRIFLSAGEASGDAYAAALVRQISRLAPAPLTFEGIGGPKLKAEGVQLYADSSHWGAISIAQAAKVFFKVFRTLHQLKHNLRGGQPGLLIAIDFGYANIRLCRYAKKHGWKVLYFVPPGSWRRDRQGRDLPLIADEIVTPFSWSAEILNRMGASAHWFGHPIKQLIAENPSTTSTEHSDTIAVLPGSRAHELEMNLPVIADAVKGITTNLEVALAPSVDREEVRREWNSLAPGRNDLFTTADTYGVLKRARAGIVCSGTATLEAVLCRCPMVVMYQLSPSMRREAKFLMKVLGKKRPKFIALPNIIMDREIVPELADENGVDPALVREQLDRILVDGPERERQLRDFAELDIELGPPDAITKTAELVLKMVG